jgi:hypothetical protein
MIQSDRVSGTLSLWGILLAGCAAAIFLPGSPVQSSEDTLDQRPGRKNSDGRFEIRFDKTPLKEILESYAAGEGYSIAFSVEPTETITRHSRGSYDFTVYHRWLCIELAKAGYYLDFGKMEKSFVLKRADDVAATKAKELRNSQTVFDGQLRVVDYKTYRKQQTHAPPAPGNLYKLVAAKDLSASHVKRLLVNKFGDQLMMYRRSGVRIACDTFAVRYHDKLLYHDAPSLKKGETIEVFHNTAAVEWNAYDPNPPVATVRGKITDEQGRPIKNLKAEYMVFGDSRIDRPLGAHLQVKDDGSFEVPIRPNQMLTFPAKFYVMANASGYAPVQVPVDIKHGENQAISIKLDRGFTGKLQFGSDGQQPLPEGAINVAVYDLRHSPMTTITNGPRTTEIPHCGKLPLVLKVRIPGYEETTFADVKFSRDNLTNRRLRPVVAAAKFRLVSRETGKPIAGACIRRFNRSDPRSKVPPFPSAGLSGPIWEKSNLNGEVELPYLASVYLNQNDRQPCVYWFYVEAENHAGTFVGPIKAGDNLGDVAIGRPLEVKGELRFDPAKFSRISGEWDQPLRADQGSENYAVSKKFDTPHRTGTVPFRLTGLRHDTLRIIVRFANGSTTFGYTFGRRSPSAEDIVYEVKLTESLAGIVITPEGVQNAGKTLR